MGTALQVASVIAALGCGLAAGVFYAFSAFVMPALDRLPAGPAVEAMQSINREALKPPLLTALVGTTILCAGLCVWVAVRWGDAGTPWVLAGAIAYLLGVIGVTRTGNIPLNEALDGAEPRGAGAREAWQRYYGDWIRWNHVRTAAGVVAGALLIVGVAVG